jgi:hypothetical protein
MPCRLARLRWRNAFAVLGTWSQQSVIQSGGSKPKKVQVLPKVRRLCHAVTCCDVHVP